MDTCGQIWVSQLNSNTMVKIIEAVMLQEAVVGLAVACLSLYSNLI